MTTVADPQQATTSSRGASVWTAPKWVTTFYSKFPLVWLDQDEEVEWKKQSDVEFADCSLWVRRTLVYQKKRFDCCRSIPLLRARIRITGLGLRQIRHRSVLNYCSYYETPLSESPFDHGRTSLLHQMEHCPLCMYLRMRLWCRAMTFAHGSIQRIP